MRAAICAAWPRREAMLAYALRRVALFVPTLAGVVLAVFFLVHLIPGDAARTLLGQDATPQAVAQLRQTLGLDAPLPVQLARYLGRLAQGDLGRSMLQNARVSTLVSERLPATLELALSAIAISVVLGLLLGVAAAVRRGGLLDVLCLVFAQLGVSMTVFWLAILLVYVFSVRLHWLPAIGRGAPVVSAIGAALTGRPGALADSLAHLALPSLALGLQGAAIICRMVRAGMLDVLASDFVRTARAKGLAAPRVVLVHALRNALLPALAIAGWQFGNLLGGAVLTEGIFGWPGMGQLAVSAISQRDLPLVQGIALTFALVFATVTLATDMLGGAIDPRIRSEA
ncbi:MAG: ABC transporter permease [Acetobacteraceae bacterium]|nr:ABC transporter permease [Acetobacteraceae bacterium]